MDVENGWLGGCFTQKEAKLCTTAVYYSSYILTNSYYNISFLAKIPLFELMLFIAHLFDVFLVLSLEFLMLPLCV